MKETGNKEKIHINKPLAVWAIINGLVIGAGIAAENISLTFGGLIAAGWGANLADIYENGQKKGPLVGKNG